MEATNEVRVNPEIVWKAWEKAHAVHSDAPLEPGERAKSTGFKYRVLDVVPGERFSILWKSLFVRLVFTHSVKKAPKGSAVCYTAEIRGFFAWPVRYFLSQKIRKNLSFVLKEFCKQLEAAHKSS